MTGNKLVKTREPSGKGRSPSPSAWLAFIPVALAMSGYAYTWFQNRDAAQYQARLDRVNQQLREFYGPLHAILESENRSFEQFVAASRPGEKNFWSIANPPNDGLKKEWRRWITEVTMPNYEAAYKIIQSRSDLITDDRMPGPLLALQAHIAGYRPVVAAWKEQDFSRNNSFYPFPQSSRAYVAERYASLKREQALLLGIVAKP
jgi:hypothetical protein